MNTISLCIIVNDDEAVLARCLNSVRDLVDEIVIVDTGSTDATGEIARRYTDKVLHVDWQDDFAAAWNYAFDQATMDYLMWLDADYILRPDEKIKLSELKESLNPGVDLVTMVDEVHFDRAGDLVLATRRERLIRRGAGLRWLEPVDPYIPWTGELYHADIAVTHRKVQREREARKLDMYETLERSGQLLTARQFFHFARALRDGGQYPKAIYYFEQFLETGEGWREEEIEACFALAGCYRAVGRWEMRLEALLRSFRYGGPRAEICTELGYTYMDREDYSRAAAWFSTALGLEKPQVMGFYHPDYWDYIPHLELCVCYWRLGDRERAGYHNEQAGKAKPASSIVEENRQYFRED